MLRTNLATRPFYNERVVQVAVGVTALVALLLTIANTVQYSRLSASEARVGASASESEQEAARLRAAAAALRTQIDPSDLAGVVAAAREANGIIDQRAFSWTGLLAQLEATLPPEVRVTAVQPRVEDGTFSVTMVTQARSVEALAEFMDALEETGAFRDVQPIEQAVRDGLLEARIAGIYLAPERAPAAVTP